MNLVDFVEGDKLRLDKGPKLTVLFIQFLFELKVGRLTSFCSFMYTVTGAFKPALVAEMKDDREEEFVHDEPFVM